VEIIVIVNFVLLSLTVNLLLLDPGDSFDWRMKLALHVRRVVYRSSFFMKCYVDSFIVTCT
jgi:hypothetical protein